MDILLSATYNFTKLYIWWNKKKPLRDFLNKSCLKIIKKNDIIRYIYFYCILMYYRRDIDVRISKIFLSNSV